MSRFKEGSKSFIIENALSPDPLTGASDWLTVTQAQARCGFALSGNGSTLIQNDRGLGTEYTLEKQYTSEGVRKLEAFRTTGFAPHHQRNRASKIPASVRQYYRGYPCSHCAKSYDEKMHVDHKDGNKQPIAQPIASDFQALCVSCNLKKREACKKCAFSGVRFDAKDYGFAKSHLVGSSTFQPQSPRCVGCYWFDPIDFRYKASGGTNATPKMKQAKG